MDVLRSHNVRIVWVIQKAENEKKEELDTGQAPYFIPHIS